MSEILGNLLNLPPIKAEDNIGFQRATFVLPEGDQSRSEVVAIGDDNIVFRAQIDSISSRSCTSIDSYGRIFQYVARKNMEVASTLTAMIEETKELPCGPYVEEFNNYLLRMESIDTVGLVKIATANVAQELTKPPLPPLVQTKPQRFLSNLFGK